MFTFPAKAQHLPSVGLNVCETEEQGHETFFKPQPGDQQDGPQTADLLFLPDVDTNYIRTLLTHSALSPNKCCILIPVSEIAERLLKAPISLLGISLGLSSRKSSRQTFSMA